MLLFSYYIEDKIDKAWFDSSNIYYAECDESDTQFKTVRVIFKNGAIYQYEQVKVFDWTMFKNAESQGKKLNELFKKAGYKYEKIGTANIEELQDEYVFRSGKGYTLYINDGKLTLMDYQDVIKYTMELPEESVINDIKSMLESIGNVVRIKNEIKD